MEKALDQFSLDDSADGPYGRNFASVKLASLLLACDDRLAWIDVLEPTDVDLARADELLALVDDSVTGICSILKPLFLVAQSDRKFRSGNLRRAVELARDAEDLALRNGLQEEKELARIRSSKYSQLLVFVGREGVGAARSSLLDLSSELLLSSSEEADKEETDDERGSERSRGGEGGGGRLKKRTRKRKTSTSTNRSSYFRRHLFILIPRLCLPLLFLLLFVAVLLLTVAFGLCRANGPSWDQRDFGGPTGPMIGRLAPSLGGSSIHGDDH